MTAELAADMPSAQYHALPSLSASGAKILLQEGGPAKYRWTMDNPQEPRDEFDVGSATHTKVLGVGDEYADAGVTAWNAKGAKDTRDKLRAEGKIPLRTQDYKAVHDMAESALKHPTVQKILSEGVAEHSIMWRDEEYDVDLRCRPDWLRPGLIADVKTCVDASPAGFSSAVHKLNYHVAAAFYDDGVAIATGEPCAWCFISIEKTPPYLTAVYQLDDEAFRIGYEKYRRAVALFAECQSAGAWPGYGNDVQTIGLPRWAT